MVKQPSTSLAFRTLMHHKGRLLVSIAGIGLAVILMATQYGFRNAMYDSQVNLITQLNADLVLISKVKDLLYAPAPFARSRLTQALSVDGVEDAVPLYIEGARAFFKNPVNKTTRPIRVLACNPNDHVFLFPEPTEYAQQLKQPDTVLFDSRSRDYYGNPRAGTITELSGHTVKVVGTFQLGTDFFIDGNVIMSERNLVRIFPERLPSQSRLDKVDIGLLRLRQGAEPSAVQNVLRNVLPNDVRVLTKRGYERLEAKYWAENTAIGFVFTLGMAVGFMVGMVICYQILYTSVLNDLPQFATLKAIGYTNAFLIRVVLAEAALLSILGFFPALVVNHFVYAGIASVTGLLMYMTVGRAALILVLTIGMCMASGTLAVRKATMTDPADVF